MGFSSRITIIIITLLFAYGFKAFRDLTKPLDAPKVDLKEYWGPGEKNLYKEDTTIKPFKITYPNEVIEKLRTRLNDLPVLTPPLENINFQYGFNSQKLKEIVGYWRTTYLDKWNEREAFFNQFPQYKTEIQGLDIHFIHVKPKVKQGVQVIPILLLHGWPGSVREFYELIPKLTTISNDKNYVFEVIAPSLVGYGWSEGSSKPGFGAIETAVVFKNLMGRLGFEKYYIQGGDWGALVGSVFVSLFPENVYGFHSNMCGVMTPLSIIKEIIGGIFPKFFVEEKYLDRYFPENKFGQLILESGYMHLQATKPDTIGTALTDSPIGLAAYIIEKFSTWTNPAYRNLKDGGLEKYFSMDSLLDNVMVYYLTNSITTSVRFYAENFGNNQMKRNIDRVQVEVPVACAKFKYEIMHSLDWSIRDKFINLIQVNHFDDGGHFAAMQLPGVLYKDIIEFVNKVRAK